MVRKPSSRFYFNNKQKSLNLLDREKNEKKIAPESEVDIYMYATDSIEYAKVYLQFGVTRLQCNTPA